MFQRFLKRPDQYDPHSDTSSNPDPQKNSGSLPDPPAIESELATNSNPNPDVPALEIPTEPEQPVSDRDLSSQAEDGDKLGPEPTPVPDSSGIDHDEDELDDPVDQDEEATLDAPLQSASFEPVPPIRHPKPRHFLERLREYTPPKGSGRQRRVIYTPQQRLLLLDTWQRSGLPAGDFAELVMVSKHTLYKWKKLFEKFGPEGLMDQPKGTRKGSRLTEVTKRAILMMKKAHPEWGVERIADMLMRGPGMSASPSAISKLLKESGYEVVHRPTKPNRPPRVRKFERAKPNQLWQTDLFTFLLKRQNRRLYLVAFMDDNSRFIVSFGLHASSTTTLVIDVLEAGIANYGPPEEVLTDNGPQFHTWRGKSRFTKQLEKRGIKQIVARPKRPQTLGKIERFWGTMWRELLEGSVFVDLADARQRIGHFIDHYNFQRCHRGIGGAVPADRFFSAAGDVAETLKARVAANALELARHGKPSDPFYLTGQVSGQAFSVHTEGERLVLNREGEPREEIELARRSDTENSRELPDPVCPQGTPESHPGEPAEREPLPPGQSALDAMLIDEPTEESDD